MGSLYTAALVYLLAVMPTLVISQHPNPNGQVLSEVARSLGWAVERIRPGEPMGKIEEPVIYGEHPFAYETAEKLGVLLVGLPKDWIMRVPEMFLRRDIHQTTLGDAYGLRYPNFVKSAETGKPFKARVYGSGQDLRSEAGRHGDDLSVLVSDVVSFEVEYRCFVLHKKIVTASIYKRDGRTLKDLEEAETQDCEAVLFAHEVVYRMDEECPAAFVLDVGMISKRGWAVISASPCWQSSLDGCNGAAVLRVLRRACVSTSMS